MLPKKFQFNKSWLLILFKLLNDTLFVVLTFFLLAMIGEGLLPGIVSSHIGMAKILILLLLNILAIGFLAAKLELNFGQNNFLGKKTISFLLIVLAALIFNSLFKVNLILAFCVFVLLLPVLYFIHKNFLVENN